MKFYNDNKSEVNKLVSELNTAVKSAQDLGAKVDSNGVVTGKSFAEIQESLSKQIEAMKELAKKQAENNAQFASATEEYNTKTAEIKALETQLDDLVKQGRELGSRITLDTVEDGKTLDEIKTLLQSQVNTLSDLVKKQQALNTQYDTDLKAYNDGVSATTKLASELATQVSALQGTAGVTVTQGATVSGKSWAEIQAGLQAEIDEAKALKAKQDASQKADDSNQADYNKKVEVYKKEQAQYEKDLAEYNKLKPQYDTDLANYNTEKAQYDRDKQAYDQAIATAQQNTTKDGYLSEAVSQGLIFSYEPTAKVTITGGQGFWLISDLTKYGNAVGTGNMEYHSGDGSTLASSMNAPITLHISDDLLSYPVVLNPSETITATYTELKNSYYMGQKISKVVYTITQPTSKDTSSTVFVMADPTNGVLNSDYDSQDKSSAKVTIQFFDNNGNPINASAEAPMLIALSSLNNDSQYGRESVSDYNFDFVKITGSAVNSHPDGIYSDEYTSAGENSKNWDTADWDATDNPNFYWAGGVGKVSSGNKISFTMNSTTGAQWLAFNSKLASQPVPIPPVEPIKPNEPKKPNPPTPPEEKPTITEDVTFTYNLYELPTAPPPTTLSGSYSEFIRPDTPNPTIETGTYTEYTTPEKPSKPIYAYHYNTLATIQDGVKQVKNSDGTDINGQTVPKGSGKYYDLTVSQLPAHRATTKVFTFSDSFPDGFLFNLEATQKEEVNKGKWDITYDKETDTATVTISKSYMAEVNKDRTKAFDVSAPRMVGTFTNDSAIYENDFTVTHNDNTYTTNVVVVSTPTPPTITTDDNGNKEENPLKTVKDSKGNDINGLNVHPESTFTFNLTWSNTNYKGITVSKEAIAKGFFYTEDIPEEAVTPLLDQAKVVVKGTDQVVDGIKFEYHESLDKAPETVQAQYKEEGISPKGGFVHVYVTDDAEQSHNDLYKVTGTDLEIILPVQGNKGFTGQFQNTAYQSDWGNGYQTNTTTNNVPTHSTTKYLVTGDTVDVNKLSATEGAVENRKANYNWVVKNVLDEYSVKNGLYKTLSLDDSDFADVQTADQVALLNSKGDDVTSEVDIQVWVDGKLYSVNGNLSNEAIASLGLQDVANGKLVGDLETNSDKIASKDKNLLLPDELNEDGKKANVEIKAVFKDPNKVPDTTYYTVYKNVSTKSASTGEIKNYLDADQNLVIENKARISYSYKYDDEPSTTKKSTATVKVPLKSPANQSAKKYVQVGDVDVSKLTDKDTVTELPSRTTPYNWIVEANLDKDAIASGTYQSLTINDDSFADLQQVSKASLRTADNKDVSALADIQVWVDGKLYSINGKAVSSSEETTATESKGNVLLPEGLDTDGKKASVKIKAVFKDASVVDAEKYYLVLHDVTYSNASTDELQHYLNKDRIVVDNVANLEYQGIFDESPKKTDDTTAETKTPIADTTVKATKYVQAGKLDVSKLTDKDKATTLSKLTDSYNWIIKAELNDDAVKGGNYTELAISDSEFADVQSVADAKLVTKDNKDVSDLVDFKVYVDGNLYSVNGSEVKTAQAKTETDTSTETAETSTEVKTAESATVATKSKILLPEGLDEDGKKGTVKIVAQFKDPAKLAENEYYFALTDVTYNQASKAELKLYAKDSKIAIGNVANVEYKGIFDKTTKTTPDVKADVDTPTPETTAKTTKYVKVGDVDVTKLTDSDISTELAKDVATYNWIVKTELSKEAVDGGMYETLTIKDSKFADVQTVKSAELKDASGKDVTDLVDIQVWKDGKLYSVNGKVADSSTSATSEAGTTTTTDSSAKTETGASTTTTTTSPSNIGSGSGFSDKDKTIEEYVAGYHAKLIEVGRSADVSKASVENAGKEYTEANADKLKKAGATSIDTANIIAKMKSGVASAIEKSDLTADQKKALTTAVTEAFGGLGNSTTTTTSNTTEAKSGATTATSATNTATSVKPASTSSASTGNVALPAGLNKDGKQGSVEIKAVFKDGTKIADSTYYLVLKDVSFADASKEELATYTSNARVTIENLAKAEYKGIFDDKAKESNEAEADVKRVEPTATPVDKVNQTVQDVKKATEKFADTGMGKATGLTAILTTLGLSGLWFWKKKKNDEVTDSE